MNGPRQHPTNRTSRTTALPRWCPAVAGAALLCSLLSLVLALAGCAGLAQSTGPQALAIMPGVINRPDNKSLRFAMLKYGLESFCQEMTKRGAPLKLSDDQPSVGRFFPQRCDTRLVEDDTNKSFLVQFFGSGYAWTNITRRIGFDAAGVVEYDPDFILDGNAMYLYFRTKHIAATSFKAGMIENPAVSLALVTAPGGFADKFGQQVVAAELTRGFTVIRRDDGTVDFGLGLVPRGQSPAHPYAITSAAKVTLANERVEVHAGQREFLGPFEVDAQGKSLFFTVGVDGAPAVDLLVVPKDLGDQWLSLYIHQPATTPPSYAPLMDDVVGASPYRKALPIARGRFYVVVDNTGTAGRSAPATTLFDDRAALVSFALQVGDAP